MAATLDTATSGPCQDPSTRPSLWSRLPRRPPRTRRQPGIRRRGRILAGLAILSATVLLLHSWIPDRLGNLGSLVETFLPWTGVTVPLLLVLALVRRSATAAVAVVLPAVVWVSLFGGTLVDKQIGGANLTVVTHNVDAANPDPQGTARALVRSGADVVALQELTDAATPAYERVLAATYRYHSVQGTVGLWSRYPLNDSQPVEIMPWTRAMRSTVQTPEGPVAVFVAHLASVRVHLGTGFTAEERDESARLLGEAVRADPDPRVVLLGDFNGTADDRSLAAVTSGMRSAQAVAGAGFGFSWPASFPVVRVDQVFLRGVTPVSAWTLPATGSDHLPVAASFRLSER